jgi:hypothetical protein
LRDYESVFSEIGDQPEAWRRIGDTVGLRFPDPHGRRDAAGRVIPHDFVLFGQWAAEVGSLHEGREMVWPEVAEEFARNWDSPEPPSAE